jgi:hypothetical protein
MENRTQQPEHAQGRVWLILAVSAIAGVVTLLIPAGLIVLPALWAYLAARTKPAWLILPAAVYGIGAFYFYSPIAALGMIVAAAGGALALYYLQIRRVSNTYTALTLAGVFLLGLYVSVSLPGVTSGAGAFQSIQTIIDGLIDYYRAALTQVTDGNTEYAALLGEYLDAFSESIRRLSCPRCASFPGCWAWETFCFSVCSAKNTRRSALRRCGRFVTGRCRAA